jgi:hypothetical protein
MILGQKYQPRARSLARGFFLNNRGLRLSNRTPLMTVRSVEDDERTF